MPPVTEDAVDLAKAAGADPGAAPASTVDVGTGPSTAAVQAAAAAGAQTSTPPPLVDPPPADPPADPPAGEGKRGGGRGGRRAPTAAEVELAELREQMAAMQARLDVAAANTVGGLQHAVFCRTQPRNDGPRLERIRTERIHPRTQQSLGAVVVVRCLECGAQRDDLDLEGV